MRPADFYDLTWAEYQRASLGYRVRLDRQWDIGRNIVAAIYSTVSKKRIKPDDIYRCIFDEQPEPMIVTNNEWAEIKNAFKITTT